jgi:peroxiredoxin
VQLRADWERFAAANLGIVAIGLSSAKRSKEFRTELEVPFPLLADPRKQAYHAYGLTRMNVLREVNLSSLRLGFEARQAYGGSISTDQDMGQLGGVFVVGTDGIVRYAQPQQRMSDVPPNDEVLAAAR